MFLKLTDPWLLEVFYFMLVLGKIPHLHSQCDFFQAYGSLEGENWMIFVCFFGNSLSFIFKINPEVLHATAFSCKSISSEVQMFSSFC